MEYLTAIGLASIIILCVFWFMGKGNGNLPPGPYGLPLIGYIPFLTSQPYLDLQRLSKVYGPIFRLRLGLRNVVVLNDYPSTKTAFSQDAFMGRPPLSAFGLNKKTIEYEAFHGLPWKEQRRFSLHVLKDLGFGKTRIEELLKEEIHDLLVHFEQFDGKPFVLRPHLSPSMSNNIATLVYGNRLKYDDPVRKMLDRSIDEVASAAGQMAWEIFFPAQADFIRLFGFSLAAKIDRIQKDFKNYNRSQIEEHEKTLDETNIRDYIDGYLVEIRRRKEKVFCKSVLEDLVGAFFAAGSETVRSTIDWLTFIMAAFPEVQEKVQVEIENVIGPHRTPCYNDHVKMPYSQATIMELMRWRTLIPLNILRVAIWDTELNGYFIPKGTIIINNLWNIHHDPEYWGDDADTFRVERFLTQDGKEITKSDYFMPFSIGKRQCPGESFARIEVFLYFVMILQNFKITLAPGVNPDFNGVLGIGLSPKPHELCLTKRH